MSDVTPPSSLRLVIGAEHAGLRLDQALSALTPKLSRSQLQRLIKDGHVRAADGRLTTRPSEPVEEGQVFDLDTPAPVAATPVAQDIPLKVLYEDPHVIVVDKPAGMVVHPGAGHADGTLVNALLHHVDDLSGIGGEARPGIVHRLDRGTSGVMVVAKSDQAHAELARQFHDREVEKGYYALVWGVVQAGKRIEEPIGRDPGNRQKMSTRARRARTAVTRITRVEHLRGVTLAQIAIATGRTHQIRVHLSTIGHPVVGDALYGGVHRRVPPHLKAVARLERPFLHATRLSLVHPVEGHRLEFTSPLPADLQDVLDALRTTAGEGD
ncbi:MAG: RluA family pseudouridine synthase [Vicinamibacterales bacterium]|jgi:23S rRNA pseudouridine1911/1915/1917 synthase|nr:RluA family pseudouridine synthase [Vicinamibacterales bacterium]